MILPTLVLARNQSEQSTSRSANWPRSDTMGDIPESGRLSPKKGGPALSHVARTLSSYPLSYIGRNESANECNVGS